MAIRLFVGLGNPGAEHERDRHNAGFWALDDLAQRCSAQFARQGKFFGEIAKSSIKGNEVWLLKPGTYMNLSGQAVAAVSNFYRITPEEILVLHDELDLMPGEFKMKLGGGSGGHNGLKDIQARIGSQNYWRARIGIGHPRTLNLQQEVADFVLKAPRKVDEQAIKECIEKINSAADLLASGEINKAVMQLHTKKPPKPEAGSPPVR
jgi:peptidyl-tRNA hydrolase, PTH1 family